MKGVGILYKRDNLNIEPLIHGGKSTTIYRSGTPALPLIVSISKALRLVYEDFHDKYKHVEEMNKYLREQISKLDIFINSPAHAIPHILNFSLNGIKAETMLHALEEDDIFISTQTACSVGDYSRAVYAVTKDKDRSSSSMRVSLSYLTTKEEIDKFISSLDKHINEEEVEKYNPGKKLPVFVFEKDNQEIKRVVGEHSYEEMLEIVGELENE